MSNEISLFGAIKVNGRYLVNESFYTDCTPQNIVTVMPCIIPNYLGIDVPAFQIVYLNPQGLVYNTIYLPAQLGLTSLANFLTGLGVVSATNKFTIYTDLYSSSDISHGLVVANTSVLINDIYTQSRSYAPDENQTIVQVTNSNRLTYTRYNFVGDQTYAGQYLYFGSGGNA